MVTLGLVFAWAGVAHAAAQAPTCSTSSYRAFDFWVGEWEVTGPDGGEAGRNRITREQKGCVLVERWQGAQGGTGMSMSYYDPVAGHWRQVWVSPQISIDITGGLEEGSMVLEGTIVYLRDRRAAPFRGTWTPMPDGRVRQRFLEADADGEWKEWFDGIYRRTGPDQSGP